MSRQGMIIAGQYASELPVFPDIQEAERVLYDLRDVGIRALQHNDDLGGMLDYSAESLKTLEQWFFENGQPSSANDGYSMSHAIGFYFGEVLCRHAEFTWTVNEFAYSRGHYEIGVKRGSLSIMLTKGKALKAAGNKKMHSLFRDFTKYSDVNALSGRN